MRLDTIAKNVSRSVMTLLRLKLYSSKSTSFANQHLPKHTQEAREHTKRKPVQHEKLRAEDPFRGNSDSSELGGQTASSHRFLCSSKNIGI